MHILPEFCELEIMLNNVIEHLIHTSIGKSHRESKTLHNAHSIIGSTCSMVLHPFITQDATDIHHYDHTIKASCLHVTITLASNMPKEDLHPS